MPYSAKEARNKYAREWYANNKDKVKASKERYWKKKAELMNKAAASGNSVEGAPLVSA